VRFLGYFDGTHEESDLALALHRATGDLAASGVARRRADAHGGSGVLGVEELGRRGASRHRAERRRRPASTRSPRRT
jgi:hypothetical protein